MQILHQCGSKLACNLVCRGLEAVRGSQRIYLEAYTSQLLVPKEQLVSESCQAASMCCRTMLLACDGHECSIAVQEKYYGKSIIVADREMVESQSDDILAGAEDEDVSFLVVGDPFGWALRHQDFITVMSRTRRPRHNVEPSCRCHLHQQTTSFVYGTCISIFAGRPHTRTWSCVLETLGYL